MKTFTSVTMCFALALGSLGYASAQNGRASDDDPTILISKVQKTLASKLDSTLPSVSLGEWMRDQVGNDAKINWVVRTGTGADFPWVEADISVGNQPGIVILIACGKRHGGTNQQPRFKSLELLRQGESAEWTHLHDLPVAMMKARQEN